MDMFEQKAEEIKRKEAPLAARMRPTTFSDFVGQEHLIGPGRVLRKAIESGKLPSVILWGPPGSGKTTLAHIIADATESHLEAISAVSAGVADLRRIIEGANDRRKNLQQQTTNMIEGVRLLSHSLRPSTLDRLGLLPALKSLASDIEKRSEIALRVKANSSTAQRLPAEVELALFRVTQEAANNIVKYARGTSVDVSLIKEDNRLELRVKDDGDGFVVTARGDKGSGISGMRERIVQLKGSFEIDSIPALGTTVIARIPLG